MRDNISPLRSQQLTGTHMPLASVPAAASAMFLTSIVMVARVIFRLRRLLLRLRVGRTGDGADSRLSRSVASAAVIHLFAV